jgi:hypothetical protein
MIHWADVLLGALFALVFGLLIALIFYRLQQRQGRRILAYRSYSIPIVTQAAQEAAEDVEILYRGTRVPQVTSTRIVIWNAGGVAIQSDDIAAAAPIRGHFRGGDVLSASIVRKRAVNFRVLQDANGFQCEFDLLNKGDGAVLDVIHTAGPSQLPLITGTIRDMPEGIRNFGLLGVAPQLTRRGPKTILVGTSFFVVLVAVFLFGALLAWNPNILAAVAGLALAVLLALSDLEPWRMWRRARDAPRSLTQDPKQAASQSEPVN